MRILQKTKNDILKSERAKIYTKGMKFCGRLGAWQDALDLLNLMKEDQHSNPPDTIAYTMATVALKGNTINRSELAQNLLSEMYQRDVEPCIISFSTALTVMGSTEGLQLLDAMRTNDGFPSPDTRSYNAVLTSCANENLAKKACTLFQQMPRDKCEPDIYSYSAVIRAVGKEGDWKKAISLLDQMETKGIRGDVIVYSSIISILANASTIENGGEIFNSQINDNVSIQVVTNNNTKEKSPMEIALLILEHRMPERNITPNVITYGSVLTAVAKTGQWQIAKRLLAQMSGKEIEESHPVKARRKKHAPIKPNLVCVNSYLRALATAGEWQEAVDLIHTGIRLQFDLAPDAVSYATAINACATGGQWEETLRLIQLMDQRKLTPSIVPWNCVLQACAAALEWEPALQILHHMREGLPQYPPAPKPDIISYSTVMHVCSEVKQWDTALRLYHILEETNSPEPDVACTRIAINVAENGGYTQYAESLYRKAVEKGLMNHKTELYNSPFIFDFHDLREGTAIVAMRVVLQDLRDQYAKTESLPPLIIIVGQGHHSNYKIPILKPTILNLLSQITPPLEIKEEHGRLIISSRSLHQWALT